MEQDIRWEQRFASYNKALNNLAEAVSFIQHIFSANIEQVAKNDLNILVNEKLIKQGLIQCFEYTHELACKVMQDYAKYQGNKTAQGNRDAIREAFQLQLISDGQIWMDMIKSRNNTSHIYNETTSEEIYTKILNEYYPAFLEFQQTMEAKRSGEQTNLFKQ